MDAIEYMRKRAELLYQLTPEEFIRVNNYSEAAMRACESGAVRSTKESILTTHRLAVRLAEMYPEGMPLTFAQLVSLKELDPTFSDPPPGAMVEWWGGV